MTFSQDDLDAAEPAALRQQLADALDFLSHDVREGHSSALALLELQRIKPDPMTMFELVERIELNARRSLATIDDFMDIARTRTQPLRLEDVDLVDLLVDVVANAWSAAQLRGVRVQVADLPDAASVSADRELLGNALAKLLRDVVARTPSGIELCCALRTDGDDLWVIEVEDPIGTAPDADASRKAALRRDRAQPGLALCRAAAERHGGSLQMELRVAQGRLIRLRLPVQTSQAPSEP